MSLLKIQQVDIYYLHAPDRTTPYEDALRAMNELYTEGKFKRVSVTFPLAFILMPVDEQCGLLSLLAPLPLSIKTINNQFGISNYPSWEVGEIITICKAHNWVQPTVYQGLYNAIHRAVEPELFPALRKYGISFYAYNPLGGGFFTGSTLFFIICS